MPLSRPRHPASRPEPPRFTRPSHEPLPWTQPRVPHPAKPDRRFGVVGWGAPARIAALVCVLALVGLLVLAVVARAEVEPGRNLELNHSIQLGVLEGWPLGSTVHVEVFRGTTRIAWHDAHITDVGNKGGTIYDINHVGGSDCWNGVPPGTTPDVQPGDLMRATLLGFGGVATPDVDSFFVRDVAFLERGGVLTGHARGVETAGGFDLTRPVVLGGNVLMEAKRVGAPVDGEAAFAPGDIGPGGEFRKPLDGTPDAGEVFIDTVETTTDASGAEGTGITVAFPSDAEPELPCGPLVTSGLTSFSVNGAPVDVVNRAVVDSGAPLVVGGPRLLASQTPDPDDTDVQVALQLNGVAVPVAHAGGAWSASIPAATIAGLPDNASFTLRATFSDGSPPATRTMLKDATLPVVIASLAPGRYPGPFEVALASDGGEQVRYTLDGSTPADATSTAYDGRPVPVDRSRTIRAFAVDAAGNRGEGAFAYVIEPAAALSSAGRPGLALVRPFRLRSLTMRRVLSRRSARRNGIVANLRLPRGTRIIHAVVLRGKRRLAHSVRRVRPGVAKYRLRLRSRRLRRRLGRGVYVLRVRVGPSRTRLGPASARRFRIR